MKGLSLASLACPACRGDLAHSGDEGLTCTACRLRYPIVGDIPVLVLDPEATQHDELHHHGSGHKAKQADYFDAGVAEEFEICRPRCAPELYAWLLREKMRRGIDGVESLVERGTVLVVCGGSGMDAEFIAGTGGQVVVSDLSLGAMKRAEERSHRFTLGYDLVVADVERLPFADRSFDLVYVHDGLHHLEDPYVGLREMTRVARIAVSVNEPAAALATKIAVRLGLALEQEEAGNRVGRLTVDGIERVLVEEGFRSLRSERYAMYYKHEPGRVVRFMSKPVVFGLAVATWRAVNKAVHAGGNKLSVLGTRVEAKGLIE